jgi:hypothetical protein
MKQINLRDFQTFVKPEIGDILLFLNSKHLLDNLVICGSLGLVLNQKLFRPVGDLDLLEIRCGYGMNVGNLSGCYRSDDLPSNCFEVGNEQISAWKINIFNTKVEFLHHENKELEFEEVEIITLDAISLRCKLENPEYAIEFKKKYINSVIKTESIKKHQEDLNHIENGTKHKLTHIWDL